MVLLVNLFWVRHQDAVGPRGLAYGQGANLSSNLFIELAIGAIEVAVLTAVLQPWLQGPIWRRALVALALFLPWLFFAFAIGMHAGSMSSAHTLWRLCIAVMIGAVAFVSGFRSLIRRRAAV